MSTASSKIIDLRGSGDDDDKMVNSGEDEGQWNFYFPWAGMTEGQHSACLAAFDKVKYFSLLDQGFVRLEGPYNSNVVVKGYGHLSHKEWSTLASSKGWLNDEIINFFLGQ